MQKIESLRSTNLDMKDWCMAWPCFLSGPPPRLDWENQKHRGGAEAWTLVNQANRRSQMLKRISPFLREKTWEILFLKVKRRISGTHIRPFSSSAGSAAAVGEDRHFESRESRGAAKQSCLHSFSKTYLHPHSSASDLIYVRTFPESCQERETLPTGSLKRTWRRDFIQSRVCRQN